MHSKRTLAVVFVLVLVFLTNGGLAAKSVPVPKFTREFITSSPPWPYSHECNVVELGNGDVLATWQAGTNEKNPDSKIWQATRDYSTGEWSDVTIAANGDGICIENACMFQNDNNRIYLIYHQGGNPHNGECYIKKWVPYISYSDDKGATWSVGEKMPKGSIGCVKNQCQTLSNGDVLCPSSTESVEGTTDDMAHFETTDQTFSNINVHKSIEFFYSNVTKNNCDGIIQPVIYEDESVPGRVFALFRSGCGVLAQAESLDYGKTWPSFADSSEVPNPGSGVDGDVMRGQPDIGWLLAYNPSDSARCPLGIASSTDRGASFQHILDIETNCTNGMYYSYPFLRQSTINPRAAHLCYTYGGDALPDAQHTMAYALLQW